MTPEAKAVSMLFYIQDKQGKKVPFRPNHAQLFLDASPNNRILIAKARQKGFSAFGLAKQTIRCLGHSGTRAVIISHEANATQRLLDRVRYYLKHMNGPQPIYGRNSRNELTFDKTDSTFYIGTAGAKAFGRGDTITDLHCSEYAWWDVAESHHAGVFQAVPITGRIIIESTGNGRNNDFYTMWTKADEMGYERMFYPWFADSEYELHKEYKWKPSIPHLVGYLKDLRDKHKLSDSKMEWFEWKLKELRENLNLMNQEYPSEPEDCFQATGGALFDAKLSQSNLWISTKEETYYCNTLQPHPIPGFHYVLGADASGGTGNDDAAIVMLCCETGEQVFELHNNTITPVHFTELCISIANRFNKAYIIPESNNHGVTVVEVLKAKYDRTKVYKHKLATASTPAKYGWQNTRVSKHALVGNMQEDMKEVTFYGASTVAELNQFEETESGRMEGKSDNLVIATGLAMLGLKKFDYLRDNHLKPPEPPKPKPNYMVTNLDDILSRIHVTPKGIFGVQVGKGYGEA